MITTSRALQGIAGVYAAMTVINFSPDSMATMRQVGLCCNTAVKVANIKREAGQPLLAPREMLIDYAVSNLSTGVRETAVSADRWGRLRCERGERQNLIGHTYLTEKEGVRRRKYYFLSAAGEKEFERLDALYDLAFLAPDGEIIGFGIIERDPE